MFEFEVSQERAVLELDLEQLNSIAHKWRDSIYFHNDLKSPASTIYLILPATLPQAQELYWKNNISLTGPVAELIILTQSDLVVSNIDFKDFSKVMVSDNSFYHDGNKFLVIKENEYTNHTITFDNCKAINASFFCHNLKWLSGLVKDNLFVKLHGNNAELQIDGSDERTLIGNLIIPDEAKPAKISITNSSIMNSFTCEGVEKLAVKNLKVGIDTSTAICRLIADEIEALTNFQTFGDALIVKAEIANISSFRAPRGKVYIDVHSFIDFKADGDGHLQGIELNVDVSHAIEKALKLPYGKVYFDKISIKGASLIKIPGELSSGEVIISNCSEVDLKRVQVRHLCYEMATGTITFEGQTKIDSLWLIGNIKAGFWGAAETTHLETDAGRCQLNIYDDFKAAFINLNLNLDRKKELFDSEQQGYFGIHIHNEGNKAVVIDTLLAKLTNLYIKGNVKLGKVMCEAVDSKYNLLHIDTKSLSQISIDEFFIGFDHTIVINKTTGDISLVRGVDRQLGNGGQIIADVSCNLKNFITIRAREGLSFHGDVVVIDGDIELFTLFQKLSVRGSLKAAKEIRLIALEDSIDLSATLNAKSLVTYAKTENYTHNARINALEFLATTIGKYVMIDSNVNANKVAVISESADLMFKAANMQASILKAQAKGNIRVEDSHIQGGQQNYSGENVYIERSSLDSTNAQLTAGKDIAYVWSQVKADNITSQAGQDIRVIFSQASTNYLVNEASGEIRIRASRLISDRLHNRAGANIEIASDSEVVSSLLINYSGGTSSVTDSSIYGQRVVIDSNKGMNIDSSLILGDYNIFLRAVENFLSINSNITLGQHPYKLFMSKADVDNRDQLSRCGLSLAAIEAIGLLGQKGYSQTFAEFQCAMVNSNKIDLGIFASLAKDNQRAIIIDVASGVIMGSKLSAKNHHVIIKAKHGLELLPLGLYNAVMFSGGFNPESAQAVISKIEAGFIDLDGGTLIKAVGALMRAAHGSLTADYIIDEPLIKEAVVKQRSLQELSIWLSNNTETYDLIVNSAVVPTQLEFSEVTKIDLRQGKVNLFYPYQSREVYLRQQQGDVNIDRDVHFPYQIMALHVDQGQIFFGIPKTEIAILSKFFGFFQKRIEHSTTEHVNVSGHDLHFSSGSGIEVHGTIEANTIAMQSSGPIKIQADKHNFGKQVKQSVIRPDNLYMTADNIEVAGSLITVKNHLKLISDNDIKIIPIELIHRYCGWYGSKTFTREMAIKQVVAEINAGMINIDAGRSAEFISCLIKAEGLDIHAKDLKIAGAKEIFEKQIEFTGKKKWYSGGRQSFRDYTHSETVVPTEISVGSCRMVVDDDATIEASQIFVKDEVLTKVGGNVTIKDGYKIHIHDHTSKKYSLLSFSGGSVKLCSTKSIRDFTEHTEGIPTLVCAAGIFHGVVNGSMHVLGSAIVGKNIHLVVPNGLKLEASKYTDKDITFVSETGAKLGFYCKGKQETGVKVGVYASKEEQKSWHQHLTQTVVVAQDTLSILVKDGTFEQISSQLAGRIIYVEARNWVARTYDEQTIVEHIKEHFEVGGKLAIKQTVTSSIDKVKLLINKKGSHVIDNFDRIFKAYDLYKSLAALPSNAATGGSYAYLEASQAYELTNTNVAVDNTVSGATIVARIKEDIRFQGVQMQGSDIDIAATFSFETSKDTQVKEYDFGRVDIDIGISNPALSTASLAQNSNSSTAVVHHQNYIKASGNLKITLAGDGKFKGVSLEGAHVDIKAKNLILESVQDVVTKKMSGSSFHIVLDQVYGMQGFSGYVEQGDNKAAWTNQIARIVGTQVVNIVVKETLELAGSLIATAEEDKKGKITDKGNLSINCGRLVVKTLHDYDDGLTLGIGAAFQVSQNEDKEGELSFSHLPLKVQLKDHKRTIVSTIGHGEINASSIAGDKLGRDIDKQQQKTKKESASFDAPIHGDMMSTLVGAGGSSKDHQKPLTVKQTARSAEQEQTIPLILVQYFSKVADSFKGALKDSLLAGASAINSVGGEVDTDELNNRIQQLFDWQHGTKLSLSEIREVEEAYNTELAKVIEALKDKNNLNLTDEEQYETGINEAKYCKFFEKLQNKPKSTAALITYKSCYLKELQEAKEQQRPLKEFSQFVKEVNHKNVYASRSNFVEKVHPAIAEALAEVELLFSHKNILQQTVIAASKASEIIATQTKGTSDQLALDYTILLLDKAKQEEVKISKETVDYLNTILGMDKKQSLLVPDFGIASKTKAIPEPIPNSGFSLISNAYANPLGATTAAVGLAGELPLLEAATSWGARTLMPYASSTAMSIARQVPSATLGAVVAMGLHNTAQFEAAHPMLSPEFNDIMTNPLIPQSVKDDYWHQATNDQLLAASSSTVTMPVMQTAVSSLLKDLRMDIDPNANKPTVLATPAHKQPNLRLVTPNQQDIIKQLRQLPGFSPLPEGLAKGHTESFPIHEQKPQDFINFDYNIEHWNVKPASIKEAPEVYQHGKFGKIYMDSEQKVGNKEIWWSKDTAKHSGASEGLPPSTYKLFIKIKTGFKWIGDADATGKVIEGKNKSEIGDRIPLKQCWKVK